MKVSKHSLFAMEICLTGSNTRRNETCLTRTNQSDAPRDVCVCVCVENGKRPASVWGAAYECND